MFSNGIEDKTSSYITLLLKNLLVMITIEFFLFTLLSIISRYTITSPLTRNLATNIEENDASRIQKWFLRLPFKTAVTLPPLLCKGVISDRKWSSHFSMVAKYWTAVLVK